MASKNTYTEAYKIVHFVRRVERLKKKEKGNENEKKIEKEKE